MCFIIDSSYKQNISISRKSNTDDLDSRYSVKPSQLSKYRAALTKSQNGSKNKSDGKSPSLIVSQKSVNSKPKVSSGADCGLDAPSCNTGGRYFNNNLSFVDWLRATTGDDEYFQNFVFDFLKLTKGAGIQVQVTDKGMLGYKRKDELIIQIDGESLVLGYLLTDNHVNEGGLFELNGKGCELLRISYPECWAQLHALLTDYHFRFTRLDIALDFHSEYALEKGYTVPSIAYAGIDSGLFNKDKQKGSQGLKYGDVGQWGELMVKGVTTFTYDPLQHADKGLTSYFGNRKSSPDFFRCYEKGKQLDGNLPEGDIERAYFRIEQEMKNPNRDRVIPLDAMLKPDSYFAEGRSNLRGLLTEMREYYKLDDVEELHRSTVRKQKTKLLTKKIEWLRETGGRTFKTLLDTLPDHERNELLKNKMIRYLVRKEGIRGFINDLDAKDYSVLTGLIVEGIIPEVAAITSDRVSLDVSKAENGAWIANRIPEPCSKTSHNVPR